MTPSQEIKKILHSWIRWLRMVQAVNWGMRGLLISTALTFLISLASILRGQLIRESWGIILSASAVAGIGFTVIFAFIRPIQLFRVSRYFDNTLILKDRTRTFLELEAQENSFKDLQLNDTLMAVKSINIKAVLPIRIKWQELIAAAFLAAVIGVTWYFATPFFDQAEKNYITQELISEQAEEIEALVEQIQSNQLLTDPQKAELIEPLQIALDELSQAISIEEAAASLNESSEQLESIAENANAQQFQDLQNAGEKLAEQPENPLSQFGEQLAEGNLIGAIDQLNQIDTGQLSSEEQQALAESLSNLAEQLAQSNPSLSENFNQASAALEQRDPLAAKEALQQATETLSGTMQQQALAEAASQSAQALGQSGQSFIEGAGLQGGQSSAVGDASKETGLGQGTSGAGKGEFDQPVPEGGEVGYAPINPENGVGDGGELTYDPIYSPDNIGGSEGNFVDLSIDGTSGELQIGELPSSFDQSGSTVPYTQVFAQYENTYRTAVDTGTIPPAFRNLVRDYFSSLSP